MPPSARTSRVTTWIAVRAHWIASLWTVGCLAMLLWTGYQHMTGTLPYVQHIDERTLMRGAKRVLQEGGLNPRIYSYPSLPFYLTAAGLAWGTVRASGEGPELVTASTLGRVEPPYYERISIGAGARVLWLLLGVSCVAAVAVLANAIGGPIAMALTALLLTITAIPVAVAREYVSVDIPLALFVLLLLAHLMRSAASATFRDRVWLPALLCGAAMASKYTGAVTLFPALLALWLYPGPSRFARSFELAALTLLVFVVLCPRFVLDLPSFLDGMSYESFHYNYKGHGRFTTEPGWAQLVAYGGDVVTAFGWGLTLLALVGAGSLAVSDPRRGAVFLSFPLCWIAMLIGAKVHFVRNLLPVILCTAVFAARGLTLAWTFSGRLADRWRSHGGARVVAARFATLALLALATLPFANVIEVHRQHADSRVRFVRWIPGNVADGSMLVIPDALPFATDALPKTLVTRRVDLRNPLDTADAARPGAYMLVPHWTTDKGGVAARVAKLAPGMNALPRHRVIREFSGAPAEPSMESEMSVNPAFSFVRFEP